jgi:ABC-2 type transport system permease protein
MSRVWTVARRELKALFDHPTGYILLIVFLVVNNFLFFRQVFLMGAASLRPMLDLLPWLLLFLVPAVTMRALADDARTGTLEVVLAQPLSEFELVLGKYLGALLFLWAGLALTLLVPVGLSLGADLPVGVIVAQYVGAMLLVAGLSGVGLWASSLTRNQITAFIVGVGVMFLLVLVGLDPLIVGLPPALGVIAARLGVLSHFANIARGVIDLRDAVYFLSLAAVFLILAYAAVLGRKLPRGAPAARRLQLGTAALVAATVVVNLLGGYIRGRLDLTPGRAYTLSPATRQIVHNLDDIVTIRLFASRDLPPQVSLLKRDVDDLLRDLRSASGGKVRIVERDPASSDEGRADARAAGVPPIQFNVVGQSQLQIREGYMGLAIQYADAQEAIPVIQRTDERSRRAGEIIRRSQRVARVRFRARRGPPCPDSDWGAGLAARGTGGAAARVPSAWAWNAGDGWRHDHRPATTVLCRAAARCLERGPPRFRGERAARHGLRPARQRERGAAHQVRAPAHAVSLLGARGQHQDVGGE